MKKLFILTILGSLALSSCSNLDDEGYQAQVTKENAEEVFGLIDPNQDWSNITSGTITVTADAGLKNIAKVQILTESPFFNDQANVLAEVDATKGQTVTLNYDAPRASTRLIAACVDNNGNYYIKGFNVGAEKVSFKSSTTRAAGSRRASSAPDLSGVSLNYDNSFLSFNALRTKANYNSWKGKNWDNDRLWWATGTVSGWTMANSAIYTDATDFTDEERETIQDIFNSSLYRDDKNGVGGRRDNLSLIRQGNAVKFFSNHLVSNGRVPLTLSPVQMASTEAYMCDIYYYYYKAEDVPAGTSETDYIKTLPKFKAIDLNDERNAFKAISNKAVNVRDESFHRLHEYILPFYGNASEFTTMPSTLNGYGFTTTSKFYRIYNYGEGRALYITNGTPLDDLKDPYTENIGDQVWQIFENSSTGKVMFYNVGAKKFLWCNNGRPEIKEINETSLDKYTFYITDGDANETSSRSGVYIYTYNKANCIKGDGGKCLGIGGKTKNKYREWTFEEYNYPASEGISDMKLPLEYFAANRIVPPHTAVSATIPDGYRIGFMIRKDKGETTGNIGNNSYGCMYGCGDLNTEINTFGQFKSAVEKYSMAVNDPRMATFTANGKTYLCFEEGSDTQYSDVILEIGGVTTTQVKKALAEESDVANQETILDDDNNEGESGVYMFDDVEEVPGIAYTMCFEDRPLEADYDMNDIVLRCVRHQTQQNVLQLSIVAVGAQDNLQIMGVPGTCVKGTDIQSDEAHSYFLFGGEEGDERFVNTKSASSQADYTAVGGFYEVDEDMTIPKFLSQIYIKNLTKGYEVHVPKKGDAPFAIIIPGNFNYPREQSSITAAYSNFSTWARNASQYGNWLEWFAEDKIFTNPYNK